MTLGFFCLLWVGSGMTIWFLKNFVYFRGISHFVYWIAYIYEHINKDKKTADLMRQDPVGVIVADIMVSLVAGPINLLDLYKLARCINSLPDKPSDTKPSDE